MSDGYGQKEQPKIDFTKIKSEEFKKALAEYQAKVVGYKNEIASLENQIQKLRAEKLDLESQASRILVNAEAVGQSKAQEAVDAAKRNIAHKVEEAGNILESARSKNAEADSRLAALDKKEKELNSREEGILSSEQTLRESRELLRAEESSFKLAKGDLSRERDLFNQQKREILKNLADQEAKWERDIQTVAKDLAAVNAREQAVKLAEEDLAHKQKELNLKLENLKTLEARERAIGQRESDAAAKEKSASDKLAKAEADLKLAADKEKNAEILDLRARRALDEANARNAAINKLNIPNK